METQNQLQKQPESAMSKFRNLLSQDVIKNKFQEALGKKAPLFMSNLVTIMAGSAELQKCEQMSVISSALMAASMDLSITPGLGFAGIVPYWDSKSGTMLAQFQVMKKGYIQLAQRTGLFKIINVSEVFEGELKSYNKFTGEYVFDDSGRKSETVIGYVSYFKLINGFEKYYYMPIEKLDKHAKKYSKSFQRGKGKWADKEEGGYEQMCEKTVLKLNLANYAPLSVDINMMNAIVYDQAEIRDIEAKDFDYPDNEDSHKPENKEVLTVGDGKTIVVDKNQTEKTARMTSNAAERIPDNKFGKAQDATIIPDPEKKSAEFTPQRGSGEMFQGKMIERDEQGNIIAEKQNEAGTGSGESEGLTTPLTIESMSKMDTKVLQEIINKDTELIEACEIIGGKNTNKKLREVIDMHQKGTLTAFVADILKKQNEEGPDPRNNVAEPGETQAGGEMPINKDFDNQRGSDANLTGGETGNKYGIVVPAPDRGESRDFSLMKGLFNKMQGITPPINNPRYLELAGKLGMLNIYPDRESFCKNASIEEINKLLNEN